MWVGSPVTFSPKKTIQHWHSEAVNYTYSTMSCLRMCGHYTQVVWAESYKVGCAVQTCSAVKDSPTTGSVIIFVCNYGKAGNRKGAPPYKEGAACSACQGDECQSNLCRDSKREEMKSYSWTPDWEIDVSSSPSSPRTAFWLGALSTLFLLCQL
ncbi:GLIPR1-like protein 1 [Paramormyrops kingsleyae]|uniref:GLIPR1-like protein 1 n=1 Tax=Paramormyrops kingsleyae TaxID=1676925 RepID=UPI003B97662D